MKSITDCVKEGGHCWSIHTAISTSPLVYSRSCRHCPAYQRGKVNEHIEWDPEIRDENEEAMKASVVGTAK